MPNYTNPQENSKGSNGKYFGGMGFSEAGRRGGKQKGKNKQQREQKPSTSDAEEESSADSPSKTNS